MEVITIDSQAFKELSAKINMIAQFVADMQEKANAEPEDSWVDSYEVCTFLKVGERTLQRLRSQRLVNFTLIRGKTFYRISEIKRLMEDNIIRRSDENLQDLITNHRLYAQQRRNTKANQ